MGYLCNARASEIVRCIPGVNDIFVYERDNYVSLWKRSKIEWFRELYSLFNGIKKARYEAVLDFTMSREFGLFFALAGIKLRAGLDYKGRGLFLTHRVKITGFRDKHVIEHYLEVMESLGIKAEEKEMLIVPDEGTVSVTDEYLRKKGLADKKFAAVIPGGGASWGRHASRKRWRAEGFAKVAETLEERGIRTVIMGDPSEKALCDYVASEMSVPPAAVENGLDLREYMGIMSRAGIVLCNDGGPLHIAVALGTKTVSIFGPVDETVYGPFPIKGRHRVIRVSGLPCRPCYGNFKLPECAYEQRCVVDIGPEKVAEACLELIKNK